LNTGITTDKQGVMVQPDAAVNGTDMGTVLSIRLMDSQSDRCSVKVFAQTAWQPGGARPSLDEEHEMSKGISKQILINRCL
jgi:hypothetical protein